MSVQRGATTDLDGGDKAGGAISTIPPRLDTKAQAHGPGGVR
jgi:hypothetical protein